ncbi:MAG: ATP-binding protein [Saprospiraceae bacterium]|nr:ATP-binding protein [Saprospiraceae bacterium]MDW8230464.1 ATP-binding protein [Saprospiraceae bacterium]
MARYFNTTGLCNPEEHYMVDPLRGKYPDIRRLIEAKQYFLIHAPRQTGKTTLLHALARRLNAEGKYISIVSSLESAGFQDITVAEANWAIINSLRDNAELFLGEEHMPPALEQYSPAVTLFQRYLQDWCRGLPKPLVLLLDEVDALYDDVLVSVLRQLRDGFQRRPRLFPQSVALVGLRDIREYRLKARGENPSLGAGSPFNVKAESFFLPVFSEAEVRALLRQHTEETGQVFTEEAIQKLYAYSGGQPWLTNALANEIVAKMLRNDYTQPITADMVEEAKERLIEQRQTHLDSLVDKINEPRVRPIVMAIISGESIHFDGFDDALRYCRDLGIIAQDSPVRFANPIYREIITRVLNSSFQAGINPDIAQVSWYVRPDGSLDMDKLLEAFVDFYRWHSESWLERYTYKEAGHQLLLMAFLQRIVNGGGRIEREMALGNGRTDLAVVWRDQVIPIEVKMNHDARSLPQGLEQLSRYMDRLGQRRGYLVLFEKAPVSEFPWEERIRRETHEVNGKEVILLRM